MSSQLGARSVVMRFSQNHQLMLFQFESGGEVWESGVADFSYHKGEIGIIKLLLGSKLDSHFAIEEEAGAIRNATRTDRPPINWAVQLFGKDSEGNANLSKLVTTPNRRGIQRAVLQRSWLSVESIKVFVGDEDVSNDRDAIRELLAAYGVELISPIVTIKFPKMHLDTFTPEICDQVLSLIKGVVGEETSVVGKKEGCVELSLDVPPEKVEALLEAINEGLLWQWSVTQAWLEFEAPHEPTPEEFEEDLSLCDSTAEEFCVVRGYFAAVTGLERSFTFKREFNESSLDLAKAIVAVVLAENDLKPQLAKFAKVCVYADENDRRWQSDGETLKLFPGDEIDQFERSGMVRQILGLTECSVGMGKTISVFATRASNSDASRESAAAYRHNEYISLVEELRESRAIMPNPSPAHYTPGHESFTDGLIRITPLLLTNPGAGCLPIKADSAPVVVTLSLNADGTEGKACQISADDGIVWVEPQPRVIVVQSPPTPFEVQFEELLIIIDSAFGAIEHLPWCSLSGAGKRRPLTRETRTRKVLATQNRKRDWSPSTNIFEICCLMEPETRTPYVTVAKFCDGTQTRTVWVIRFGRPAETHMVLVPGSGIAEQFLQAFLAYRDRVPQTYTVHVPLAGLVVQSYSVNMPYTEQVGQAYTVCVPVTARIEHARPVVVPYIEHVEQTYTVWVPQANEVFKCCSVCVPYTEFAYQGCGQIQHVHVYGLWKKSDKAIRIVVKQLQLKLGERELPSSPILEIAKSALGLVIDQNRRVVAVLREIPVRTSLVPLLDVGERSVDAWKWLEIEWNLRMIDQKTIPSRDGRKIRFDEDFLDQQHSAFKDFLERASGGQLVYRLNPLREIKKANFEE